MALPKKPQGLKAQLLSLLSRTSEEARLAMAIEFTKACNKLDPAIKAEVLSTPGGLVVYGGPDSPFNRVFGYGAAGNPLEDLARVESFYWPKLVHFDVELAPQAAFEVMELLEARQYRQVGVRQIWACPLAPLDPALELEAAYPVLEIDPLYHKLWVELIDQAFGQPLGLGAPATFHAFTRMPSVKLCLALDEGRPVGGGALFLRGQTGILFCAGVLLEARHKGIYHQLIRSRLALAQSWGANLALAETGPSSPAIPILRNLGFTKVCELPLYGRRG